jgi:EmrB/QacA subfamily drug resistance transporter
MTVANAMILIDQTAVPVALPAIMDGFHVGSADVQWVLNCSLLPLAGLLVLGGRLGDLFGRRRIFVAGAALFAGASAIGGLAPDFPLLLAARVAQGVGGALMLPTSVAIVSATFPAEQRGRALGTMGGAAAVAGALGPTLGGVLTSAFSWRAVLLVNAPLVVVCIAAALRAVPEDAPRRDPGHVDLAGAALLCVALIGLCLGFTETQGEPWISVPVVLPLAAAVLAAALFVVRERIADPPLMSLALLRRHRNYLGATISQAVGGVAEIGLGVIFPLLLILNLGMTPAEAGLALIPTTVPMIIVSPLAGRWYDRSGGRPPLVTGYALLAVAGVALAVGASGGYLAILPGLLLYGVGLALILTTNDPVTLDNIDEADHGQASGVSATAEQGGGALGIALLYALFHTAYVDRLHEIVDASPLPDPSSGTYEALRANIEAAEETGLRVSHFDPSLVQYLYPAEAASEHGYELTFLAVSAIALIGLAAVALLVRRPPPTRSDPPTSAPTLPSR